MRRFGELPSDLRKQDHSVGPPPAWWTPQGVSLPSIYPTRQTYPAFHGYEMNGSAEQAETYFAQFNKTLSINSQIPAVAAKYTKIDKMSPLFRNDISKSGFGDWDLKNNALKALAIVGALVVGRWALKQVL